MRDGVDGLIDDSTDALAGRLDEVAGLDRAAIRASVLERFSAVRMADDYERLYERMIRPPARDPVAIQIEPDGVRPGS